MSSPDANTLNRFDFAAIALLVLLLIWQMFTYERIERIDGDAAHFLGLAQSIREQGTYEFDFRSHVRFPPGVPLLIAGYSAIFSSSHPALLQLLTLLAIAGLALNYLLLRRLLGSQFALAGTALLGSAAFFFRLCQQHVNSDIPYFFVSMAVLFVAYHLERSRDSSTKATWLRAILMSALVLSAVLLRSIGSAFIVAFACRVVDLLFFQSGNVRRSRLRFVFLVTVIPAVFFQVLWFEYTSSVATKDWAGEYMHRYSDQMRLVDPHEPDLGLAGIGDFAERAIENLFLQSAHFSELLLRRSWIDPLWYSPLVLLPLIFISLGWGVSFRYRRTLLEWYFLAYVGICLLWPFDERARFIFQVFPLMLLYGYRGFRAPQELFHKRSNEMQRAIGATSGLVFLGGGLSVTVIQAHVGMQAKLSLLFWFLIIIWSMTRAGISEQIGLRFGWRRVHRIYEHWGSSLINIGGRAVVVMLVGIGLFQQVEHAQFYLAPDPKTFEHYRTVQAANWLRQNVSPTDVIMAGKEDVLHWETKLRVVPFPPTIELDQILTALQRQRVRYLVVLDDSRYPYFRPTEEARLAHIRRGLPDLLQEVYRGEGFSILELMPTPRS